MKRSIVTSIQIFATTLLILTVSASIAQSNQDIDECSLKPDICKNGATCLNVQGGYKCQCVNGWTGHDCSENVDDCSTAACQSGATCHDRVGYFYCQCPPGKLGLLCQLDDGCFHNPCQNNASCTSSSVDGRAHCECTKGFTGADCSIDIDECAAGSPCEHGGSCVNTPGSFRCDCPRGFTGSRCEININECENNPCMNEGTCLDEKGGFKCICMPGYTGQTCQINIDDCASNPCQHGAICKDEVNSFRCLCQAGNWGGRCEYPLDEIEERPPIPRNECEISDCEIKRHNGKCDQECNSLSCAFDGGDCLLGTGNPWAKCSNPFACWAAFKDGKCDRECNTPECLYDGTDCYLSTSDRNSSPTPTTTSFRTCDDKSDTFCLDNYANNICNPECNTLECGWDGADCEPPISSPGQEFLPTNTQAQGLLVIRVEPAIVIGPTPESHWDVETARLLRQVSVVTKTILKIQNFRQIEEGNGTEIVLIADNRKCQASCYNSTELIAKFLSALKTRTKAFESGALKITGIRSQEQQDINQSERRVPALYLIMCAFLTTICALLMVMTVGNKQKVKEKAVVWFPEGFKPVMSSRKRDPTQRKPSRGVSTLQALGGNFFRGIKRNERNISTDPNGIDIDRCNTATPNGGGIYHVPYDQYDQYGTYNAESTIDNVDEPMTPPTMHKNPIDLEGPHGLTSLMVASMGHSFTTNEPLDIVSYGTTGEINGSADQVVSELLQRGAQVNIADKVNGETALHIAARHGRVDSVKKMLERCDAQVVNAKDANGRTPLHAAIASDSRGAFECLKMCRHTDLNAQTNDGTTPLILAVKVNAYYMLEELILVECEVTKTDDKGRTALHWAAATDNKDAIRRLLAVTQVNKDAGDAEEATPLYLAAREGARGAVELLLSHNANKDICDAEGVSPIRIARERNHYDIVKLLEEHEPLTPKSISSVHQSSRQISPLSPPITDSNGSSIPPISSYHSHTQSGTLWHNNNNPKMANINNVITHTQGLPEPYNVPYFKNYIMTPSPDSPFNNNIEYQPEYQAT